MASSPRVMFLIICFLTIPSKSGVVGLKEMEVRVGSMPPRCVNKCFSCRPCTATVVVSRQQNDDESYYKAKSREESYYLLSWKCKCGDKLFQP